MFQLGKQVQTLKWNVHYFLSLTKSPSSRGSPVKFVRQARCLQRGVKETDELLRTGASSEERAIHAMLALCNNMSISASNMLNEMTHKRIHHKRGMGVGRQPLATRIDSYHAGLSCALVKIILEKLQYAKLQHANFQAKMIQKVENAERELFQFEMSLTNSGLEESSLSKDLKYQLLEVYMKTLVALMYAIGKI